MLWIVNSIGCSLATEWFKKFSIKLIFNICRKFMSPFGSATDWNFNE